MKIRFFGGTTAVACLSVLLFATIAEAQPPGGRRGPGGFRGGFGGGGPSATLDHATLLRSTQVREELKIGDDQAETVDAALQAYRQEQRSILPDRDSFQGQSREERRETFEKLQNQRQELSTKTDEVLAALLAPEQLERLDQIVLQIQFRSNPVETVTSDELRKKLELTDEQVAELQKADEAANEKRREMFSQMFSRNREGGRPDREEMQKLREQMQEQQQKLNQEAQASVMGVLSDEQEQVFAKATGENFELDMRSLRGGRGGFGRGRGDGDGDGEGRRRGNRRGGRGRGSDDAI